MTENRSVVARDKIGSGGVSGGRDYTGTFWKVKDTFVTLIVVMVSHVYAYVCIYPPVYFQYVQLILC